MFDSGESLHLGEAQVDGMMGTGQHPHPLLLCFLILTHPVTHPASTILNFRGQLEKLLDLVDGLDKYTDMSSTNNATMEN